MKYDDGKMWLKTATVLEKLKIIYFVEADRYAKWLR